MSKRLEKIIHSRKFQKLRLITKWKRNFKNNIVRSPKYIKCYRCTGVGDQLGFCREGYLTADLGLDKAREHVLLQDLGKSSNSLRWCQQKDAP